MALKEAKGSIERIHELIEHVGDAMHIYSGDDGTAMESMLVGGKGNISVVANVVPEPHEPHVRGRDRGQA